MSGQCTQPRSDAHHVITHAAWPAWGIVRGDYDDQQKLVDVQQQRSVRMNELRRVSLQVAERSQNRRNRQTR